MADLDAHLDRLRLQCIASDGRARLDLDLLTLSRIGRDRCDDELLLRLEVRLDVRLGKRTAVPRGDLDLDVRRTLVEEVVRVDLEIARLHERVEVVLLPAPGL